MIYSGKKESNTADRGLVFNIQKISLHDGSGIRTLVFLKGCPLKCKWCANPEGQSHLPELAFNAEKCIGTKECDYCRRVCKQDAIDETDDGKVRIDRKRCTDCGDCAEACPSRALELFGEHMSVDDIIGIVEEDSSFYARSGGGLTVSGGEPLLQAEFVIRLLEAAQSRGIDTAIETTGYCGWEALESACRSTDLVFYDIKSLDAEKHRSETGVDNKLILENLRKLCENHPQKPITVRTPIIPGFNDSPEDARAIANFVNGLSRSIEHELLPYHRFGEPKYRQIDKRYPLQGLEPPTDREMEMLKAAAEPRKCPQ